MTTAAVWRKEDHPRVPGGEHGGEFTHAPGGGWESMLDSDIDVERGMGNRDHALEEMAARVGFDARPDLVSDADLDKRVAAGEREMWRGINSSGGHGVEQSRGWAEGFLNGPYFGGLGGWGNGTYVAHRDTKAEVAKVEREFADEPRNPDGSFKDRLAQRIYDRDIARAEGLGRDMAAGYASYNGTLLRMTLDAKAKVITWDDLRARWQKYYAGILEHPPEPGSRKQREYNLLNEPGRFALSLGYDAIDVSEPAHGEFVILNRGALHVSSALQDPYPDLEVAS